MKQTVLAIAIIGLSFPVLEARRRTPWQGTLGSIRRRRKRRVRLAQEPRPRPRTTLQVPPICITYGDPVVPASGDSVTCAQQIQAGTHENPGVTVDRHRSKDPVTHGDTQAVAH